MSLVNDALRKARLEAARQETNRAGAILPTLGQVRQEREQRSIPIRTVGMVALFGIALLSFLYIKLTDDPDLPIEPTGGVVSSSSLPPTATSPNQGVSVGEPETAGVARATQPPAPETPVAQATSAQDTPGVRPDRRPVTTETRRRTSPAPASSPPRDAVAAETPLSTSPTSEPRRSAGDARARTEESTAGVGTTPITPERAAETASSGPVPEAEAAASEVSPAAETPAAGIESFVRQATIPGLGSFSLDGIAWSSDRPFALVNGQVIGPGGSVDGATLAQVARDRVVLERDGRRFELTLR